MFKMIKTTVMGGVVFLIPVVILFVLIRKALELTNGIAVPLAKRLPVESVAGVAITHLKSRSVIQLMKRLGRGTREALGEQLTPQ